VLEREQTPVRVAYERRNRDLDPQLVWRGKDELDWSDLDDLLRRTRETRQDASGTQPDLFADFNCLPEGADADRRLTGRGVSA
jgi:adenine-specific DNA-methyltransferase